jgi:hypothetical protein
MRYRRRVNWLAVASLAAASLVGLVLWSSLPGQMAIHWGANGSPDNHVAKPLAVVGLPTVGVASILFVRLAPDSLKNTPGGEDRSVLFVAGVFTLLQGTIYAWNLGHRFDIWLVVAPILLGTAVVVAVSTLR